MDRRKFITALGGAGVVGLMSPNQRAEALERYMIEELEKGQAGQAQAQTQGQTQGQQAARRQLTPMPEKPTLVDFFKYRFAPASHVLQSANRALKTGMSEEVIIACLCHDVVLNLIKPDHGWWGAQLFEPYLPPKSVFAIRYHQTLRFFPDEEAGYEYPESYYRTFGIDYVPPPHIQQAYKFVRNHKWYMEPRMVTVNDLYSFDPNAVVTIEPFIDIVGRNFKQPKEGLGNDNSPVAHMWRTIIKPDSPL